ncbi:MAG: cyclase family protein [Rhodospirillales bacterium]|nr:cyclase family protein [Rhodospirillales bacterium]
MSAHSAVEQRWKVRPEGSNWGEFGPDDQHGRMNLITAERRRRAAEEVRDGLAFCLSLPLDRPGGNVLNANRHPPCFHPVMRGRHVYFNLALECTDPRLTDVGSDEAVVLYDQYSTHWDSFAHKGSLFDADADGTEERVFYNGYRIVNPETGQGTQGTLGATAVSIAAMAETSVQGRGVLVDLRHHLGDARVEVGYEQLRRIMESDGVEVKEGDILLLHTGLGQLIVDANGAPGPELRTACAVLDGRDTRLLQWITESGLAAIAADNLAVERSSGLGVDPALHRGAGLPLHEHCLFKLGIHLGELWYLTEFAAWMRAHGRSRCLLTAPPLRLPGAAGAPATPVATV